MENSNRPPRYYCHTCKKEIEPLREVLPELQCPTCKQDFIEELEEEPPAPAPTPAPPPPAAAPPPPFPLPFNLPFDNNGQVDLLPLAQALRQMLTQVNTNVNNINVPMQPNGNPQMNTTTNNNGTFSFASGPFRISMSRGPPRGGPGFPPGFPPMNGTGFPPMNGAGFPTNFNMFLPMMGGPIVGNPGDYVFGGNFDQILNQLFQTAHHTGTPPAAKSAVDDLKKGQIDAAQVENKLDCAICKEEFTQGNEYIEMPCKHIFDKECIMQWLAIHNSCPVCRYELKTDNVEYEARHGR